jgi:NAD(P)-dependent dehydrogenase (short-subunit alcohol dehydrogenase family)
MSRNRNKDHLMSGKLDGKVAVVTGGSTGIGLAIAKEFVAQGAHVFITGRRAAELDKAATEIGRNVTAVQGDVAKLEDIDRLYATVAKEKGRIDVLVANAGILENAPTADATPDHFDRVFAVNVRGAYFTIQKALKLLQDGGSIVVTASVVQYKGFPGAGIYSATKAAVRSLVRTWAAEFKSRGIRVNAVSPGPIETPMFESFASNPEDLDAHKKAFAAQVPLGRLGRPEEIAKAALFLASSDSNYTTGFDLLADGGISQI